MDDFDLIHCTLIPGTILLFFGSIGIIAVMWDEISQYRDRPSGFNGWFWNHFKWPIMIQLVLGLFLILT